MRGRVELARQANIGFVKWVHLLVVLCLLWGLKDAVVLARI